MSASLQLCNTASYLDPDLIRELLSLLLGLECFAEKLRRVFFFFCLLPTPPPPLSLPFSQPPVVVTISNSKDREIP